MRPFHLLIPLLLLPLVFSGGGSATDLETLLRDFCTFMYDIVGQVAMVMILLSSIVFSLGQFLGAEQRARMVVWAHNLFMGAITGILLAVLLPWALGTVIGGSFDPNTCTFTVS